jgi:hypothetical protein
VEDKSTLLGIEVEIENLPEPAFTDYFWGLTDDGSLRNYGREYISQPLRANMVEYALRYLFRALEGKHYKFSPRCSVHVHMNVRTMTPQQVYHLILVYLLFEKLIFNWIGQDRDKNIHCVPLSDTILVSKLERTLHGQLNNWHKYTALNVLPISKKGTIEFRHMHGTDDIKKLMTWINIILKLKMFVYKNDDVDSFLLRLFALNSTSQYRQFAYTVFGKEITDDLLASTDYIENMEKGVNFAKRLYVGKTPYTPVQKGTMLSKFIGSSKKVNPVWEVSMFPPGDVDFGSLAQEVVSTNTPTTNF